MDLVDKQAVRPVNWDRSLLMVQWTAWYSYLHWFLCVCLPTTPAHPPLTKLQEGYKERVQVNTVYVLSHTQVFVTPWTACQAPLCMEFSRQEYWSNHFLLQGIFPTKGLNPSVLCLLHRYGDSLPPHHLGSPEYYVHSFFVTEKEYFWSHKRTA